MEFSQKQINDARDEVFREFLESSRSYDIPEQSDYQNKKRIRPYVEVTPHVSKFYFSEFVDILATLVKLKNFSPQNISVSFMLIGQYAKHLIDQPWKTEFRKIKTYGGFYQVHIASHIISAIKIFELMGYKLVNTVLVLDGEVNHEAVAKVYFCCVVASCEMDVVQNIYDVLAKTCGRYDFQDIMRCRNENTGNEEQGIKWMIQHSKPTDTHVGSQYKDYGYKRNKDDNFTKTGALDAKLPKIISKYSTDGVSPAAKQLFTKTLREDCKNHDFKYKDPVLEGFDVIPNITENNSDEDLYEPADLDEHMERSLGILNAENDSVVNIPPDTNPQGGAGEWDFVRVKLAKEFGTEYFDGERGDLTKMAPYKTSFQREPNEVHIKSKPAKQITVNLTPSPEDKPLAVDCPASPISPNEGEMLRVLKPTDLGKVLKHKQEINRADQGSSLQISSASKGYHGLTTIGQSSQTPTEIKMENWQCQACTLTNESASLVCIACGRSREIVKSPTLTSGGPECPQCTLVNKRGAEMCEACNAPLAGSPTYI